MQFFLALDLEATGLNHHKCVPLEVGAVLMDEKLETLFAYESIIRLQDGDYIEAQALAMHLESGLLAKCLEVGRASASLVFEELENLLKAHVSTGDTVHLVGKNMDKYDLPILQRVAPTLAARLHYRSMDVSGLYLAESAAKLLSPGSTRDVFPKPTSRHRALDDARDAAKSFRDLVSLITAKRLKPEEVPPWAV